MPSIKDQSTVEAITREFTSPELKAVLKQADNTSALYICKSKREQRELSKRFNPKGV